MGTPEKIILSKIDWCNLTDPPCPHGEYDICGIREILRGFLSVEERERWARYYLERAEKDPKGFQKACLNELLS